MDRARRSPVRCDCTLIAPLRNGTSHIHKPGLSTISGSRGPPHHANCIAGDHFLLKGGCQQQIPFILSKIYCSATWPFPVLHSLRGFSLLSPQCSNDCLQGGLQEADAFLQPGQAVHACTSYNLKWRVAGGERKGRESCLLSLEPVPLSVKYNPGHQKAHQEERSRNPLWPRNCSSHYCTACKKAFYSFFEQSLPHCLTNKQKKSIHIVLGEKEMGREVCTPAFARVSGSTFQSLDKTIVTPAW